MLLERHIEALVNEFDIEPRLVREIIITNKNVELVCYSTNDDGKKFINADGEVALQSVVASHRAFFA